MLSNRFQGIFFEPPVTAGVVTGDPAGTLGIPYILKFVVGFTPTSRKTPYKDKIKDKLFITQ